jgi:hypothetical protein
MVPANLAMKTLAVMRVVQLSEAAMSIMSTVDNHHSAANEDDGSLSCTVMIFSTASSFKPHPMPLMRMIIAQPMRLDTAIGAPTDLSCFSLTNQPHG